MAYIKELIETLFEEENEGNIESFKKLIYLSVNESQLFTPHALELANTICPILHCIEDTTTKIYALQLLSELATNYKDQIAPKVYDFQQAIALLTDDNVGVAGCRPKSGRQPTTSSSSSSKNTNASTRSSRAISPASGSTQTSGSKFKK